MPGEEELDQEVSFGDAGREFFANLASETPDAGPMDVVDCYPVGNYERDPSGTMPGCCAGLHQVEQRVSVFSDDSTSSCSFTPVGPFACIEGACGDGRCEVPEAVSCGCSLDCAIVDE